MIIDRIRAIRAISPETVDLLARRATRAIVEACVAGSREQKGPGGAAGTFLDDSDDEIDLYSPQDLLVRAQRSRSV